MKQIYLLEQLIFSLHVVHVFLVIFPRFREGVRHSEVLCHAHMSTLRVSCSSVGCGRFFWISQFIFSIQTFRFFIIFQRRVRLGFLLHVLQVCIRLFFRSCTLIFLLEVYPLEQNVAVKVFQKFLYLSGPFGFFGVEDFDELVAGGSLGPQCARGL